MSLQVNKEGTVAIRRKTSRPVTACAPPTDDEDPYGRLTNMKLTSFTEEQQMLQLQQQQQESLFHLNLKYHLAVYGNVTFEMPRYLALEGKKQKE